MILFILFLFFVFMISGRWRSVDVDLQTSAVLELGDSVVGLVGRNATDFGHGTLKRLLHAIKQQRVPDEVVCVVRVVCRVS